jgi:hypothetical protein
MDLLRKRGRAHTIELLIPFTTTPVQVVVALPAIKKARLVVELQAPAIVLLSPAEDAACAMNNSKAAATAPPSADGITPDHHIGVPNPDLQQQQQQQQQQGNGALLVGKGNRQWLFQRQGCSSMTNDGSDNDDDNNDDESSLANDLEREEDDNDNVPIAIETTDDTSNTSTIIHSNRNRNTTPTTHAAMSSSRTRNTTVTTTTTCTTSILDASQAVDSLTSRMENWSLTTRRICHSNTTTIATTNATTPEELQLQKQRRKMAKRDVMKALYFSPNSRSATQHI